MSRKCYPLTIENELSFTKISCYSKCKRLYFLSRVLNTPIDFKCVDGSIGEVTHEFARQIAKINFKSSDALIKKALFYLENKDGKGYRYKIRIADCVERKRYEEKKGLMICMLKALYDYIETLKKFNLIVEFEKRFNFPFLLNNYNSVLIEGRFDLIIKSRFGNAIIDYKTGFIPPEEYNLRDYQMTIYQWAYQQKFSTPLEYIATCHYAKDKKLVFNRIPLRIEKDFEDLRSLILSYKIEINNKLADAPIYDVNDPNIYRYHPLHEKFPKNPDKFFCKALCEYEKKCREVEIESKNRQQFIVKTTRINQNEQLMFDFSKKRKK